MPQKSETPRDPYDKRLEDAEVAGGQRIRPGSVGRRKGLPRYDGEVQPLDGNPTF
jgi:hypothetical protein